MALMKSLKWMFLAVLALSLIACARSHPNYSVVTPTVQTLRADHIGLLQRTGVQVVQQGQSMQLILPSDVLFAPRSANLVSRAYPMLARVGDLLPLYQTESIRVAAYTGNSMPHRFAHLLSERQAQSVTEYLWPKKLNAALIYAVGAGARHPIASNTAMAGQSVNRRVVISWRFYPVLQRYN
jgi:outer membrane protein OmpA-like peptidoglycan-associated protein